MLRTKHAHRGRATVFITQKSHAAVGEGTHSCLFISAAKKADKRMKRWVRWQMELQREIWGTRYENTGACVLLTLILNGSACQYWIPLKQVTSDSITLDLSISFQNFLLANIPVLKIFQRKALLLKSEFCYSELMHRTPAVLLAHFQETDKCFPIA